MTQNAAYASPRYDCDLIMKGGITSGVVYPPAISEIAVDHRLHSIGGTSAGAIAAAAAAAAELGRDSDSGGFHCLLQIPDELKATDRHGRTLLFRLFQPARDTSAAFNMIWNYRKRSGFGRFLGLLLDLARSATGLTPLKSPLLILGTVALAALTVALAGAWALILAVPAVIVAIITAGALRLADIVPKRLADNSFGLCSGMRPSGATDPAVTEWLHDRIQTLAGRNDPEVRNEDRQPVTFGDLTRADVELVVLTTNLSRGTSETIPFRQKIWAYRREELEPLFPRDVIEHLERHSRPFADPDLRAETERLGLKRLPPHADLPIIVAARMSMSFPILLSAVPLWGLTDASPSRSGSRTEKATFVKNWFSDGGITSNLPVQMFDKALPGRPTYGINLGGGAAANPAHEAENLWRPVQPNERPLAPTVSISSVAGVMTSVFDTMQNWADNDHTRAAGFRDRICTIRLGEGEGGMNLDMPPPTIDRLVKRGAAAGDDLASIRRGTRTHPMDDLTAEQAAVDSNQWERHRWIRFRMAIAGVADLLDGIKGRWKTDEHAYRDLAQSVSPDAPEWHSYRHDWSTERSMDFRDTIDQVFDDGGLTAPWIKAGQPAGVNLTFGPDRNAGTVEAN